MAGDGLGVAGRVELEVLRVVGLLLLGIVLGHGGRWSESGGRYEVNCDLSQYSGGMAVDLVELG